MKLPIKTLTKSIIFSIIISLSISSFKCQILVSMFKQEVSHLAVSAPNSPERFVNGINSNGDVVTENFPINEMNNILTTKHNLPASVVDKFKGIVFARSLTFQSFCFVLANGQSTLDEFIGAARNVDNVVEAVFIKVN